MKKKRLKPWHYVCFGILGTIFLVVVLALAGSEEGMFDETTIIQQGWYNYWVINAEEFDELEVNMEVLEGQPVNMLLLDAFDFADYTDNETNTVFYYERGSGFDVLGKNYVYEIENSGSYYIVIENLGNLTNSSEGDAKIHLRMKLNS
jgi:hypothetical protein